MKTTTVLSALTGLVVALAGAHAHAAATTTSCVPNSIAFTDNNAGANGGYMSFTCKENPTWTYFVMVKPNGCGGIEFFHSIESVKIMTSLVQSALLSGKAVDILHDKCQDGLDNVVIVSLKR